MSLRGSWHLIVLAAVTVAVVLAAVGQLGTPTSTARTSHELVTAATGVVQSTVTGSGNVEPATDVEASFQTSGTLQHVYVNDGSYVLKGELIATLNPSSAQSSVDQAQESLTAAEDQLANAESATVVSSAATSTSTTASSGTSTTATAATDTRTKSSSGTSGSSSPSSGTTGSSSSSSSGTGSSSSSGQTGSSSAATGETADTKAANVASAQASVDGAEASLTEAQQALDQTRLYAPATGTIVSLPDATPGDAITGGSASSGSSSGSSSSSSSSTGTGSSSGTTAGSLGGSSSGSSSSSSSSSGFAEIVNTRTMTMTVAFDESDVSKVHLGQPATVTMEALTGVELAARVTAISTLATTSDSVVSYEATLTLEQHDSQVKPGMSATATVITGQARGVTLPSSAISTRGSSSTVQLLRDGRTVSTPVVTGMTGDSRTQIVAGVNAGQQVEITETLPSLSSSSSSSSSGTLGGSTGSLRRALGGGAGGFGGGAGGFGGGAGGAGGLPAAPGGG